MGKSKVKWGMVEEEVRRASNTCTPPQFGPYVRAEANIGVRSELEKGRGPSSRGTGVRQERDDVPVAREIHLAKSGGGHGTFGT